MQSPPWALTEINTLELEGGRAIKSAWNIQLKGTQNCTAWHISMVTSMLFLRY